MRVNDNCVGCGICEESCGFDAISIIDGKAFIDKEKCVGCGLCADICPLEAIEEAA